ncbi:hypothetical protein GYA13_04035 [Candidatus Kuenenbacteria bacterium]|nr:hypothetical protein [Candidatus Kuenenbacteria bacterium]
MKISQYIKEYTDGKSIGFHCVMMEVNELIVEILRINWGGIKEEFEDLFHFLQLWLYWRFGIDGDIWKITRHSVKKFMDRKSVWNKIYLLVGLSENISGYAGNYKRIEKVVNHLQKFGIDRQKAERAFGEIIK